MEERNGNSNSHQALVDRVASSSVFQKSNRLRELLLFLSGRTLADPNVVVREQEIGVEVFGRTAGYDTAQDNLVRVQASQLRKKLQQYFGSEGQDEPVVIEVPKGSYTLLFRKREAVPGPESASSAPGNPQTKPFFWIALVLALAAGAAGGALGARFWMRPSSLSGSAPRPTVDVLWQQMFGNGRPACVVPSDSNLVLFQDLLGRQLSMNEYRRNAFPRVANEEIAGPRERALAIAVVGKPCTHIADARLVGLVTELNTGQRIHTDVVYARDFGVSYLQSHNVTLLGTRRANPWLELFEDQLNFRTRFQEAPRPACSFENHKPLPGERAAYDVSWGRLGYCRVAFLPNPARTGSVLLISGTDLASTEAGGEFIGSEHWIQALRARLGMSPSARFPYFEALLEIEFPAVRSPKFNLVAHRIPKP